MLVVSPNYDCFANTIGYFPARYHKIRARMQQQANCQRTYKDIGKNHARLTMKGMG